MVDVVVSVAVDPQGDSTLPNERVEIGRERRTQRTRRMIRRLRLRIWRMVGDHNCSSGIMPRQLVFQPSDGLLMNSYGVTRAKNAIFRAEPNDSIVIHHVFRRLHGGFRLASQRKICPEGAAKKREASKLNGLIFEQLDVTAPGLIFQPLRQFRKCVPVKFVIPKHINHGLVTKMAFGPFQSLASEVDVPRKHHNVRLGRWNDHRAKF